MAEAAVGGGTEGRLAAAALGRRWWEGAFLLAFFPLIALAEWLFAYQDVALGVAMALVLALVLSAAVSVVPFRATVVRSIDSLILVPLYVLFTASLPWFFLDQQYLIPAVYSIVLGLCLWHIHGQGLTLAHLREIGFRRERLLTNIFVGVLMGVPLGVVEFYILYPAAPSPSFQWTILGRDALYMFLFVGLGEELLFRGLIQRELSRLWGWRWGLLLTSLLFATMHLTWRSPGELVLTFGAGLILGYLYHRTRSLIGPIALHGMNNVFLVAIMPYVV